jgi:hypothetical protein
MIPLFFSVTMAEFVTVGLINEIFSLFPFFGFSTISFSSSSVNYTGEEKTKPATLFCCNEFIFHEPRIQNSATSSRFNQ